MSKATVLVCRCANTDFVPRADVDGLISRLRQAGCAVTAIDDLCGLIAQRDPLVKQFASCDEAGGAAGAAIVACFPRGVRALFAAAEAKLPENVDIHNLRTQSADEILHALSEEGCEEVNGLPSNDATANLNNQPRTQSEIRNEGSPKSEISSAWLPWFPTIDYSRCRHCRQCANFCLFGVYSIDDGKVKVARPASCKPLCPACARLCPHAAIIFPKYGSAPINGDEVTPENIGREHVGEELLGSAAAQASGDLLETLRQRAKGFHGAESSQQAGPVSAEPSKSEIRNPKSEIPFEAQRILDSARRQTEQASNRQPET